MKHFYESIPGWFDFADLYADQVKRVAHAGAIFVETGVYLGRSTAFMAVEIANSGKQIQFDAYDIFQGVDEVHWKGLPEFGQWSHFNQEQEREKYGTLEAAARARLEAASGLVTLTNMDAMTAASRYDDATVDFVFLDDNHSTLHVLNEMDAWWPKVKPGGIMAGHDIDWPSVEAAVHRWGIRRGRPAEGLGSSWFIRKPVKANEWLVTPKRRKCLVAVCCNERNIPRHAAESLARIGWGARVADAARQYQFKSIDFTWVSRYLSVADLRDEAVLTAIKSECSHILFLDADMVWPADVLDRMLRHHHRGIVSGLYHLKSWPHWPVALKNATWNAADQQYDYIYDEHAHAGDEMLRSEQLVGMGCTLIPTEIFQRYERPWFKYQNDGEGMTTITEDVYFCQQALALGCPIWLDPSVTCGHISQQPITGAWFDRATYEMQMMSAGQRRGRAEKETA